MKRMDILSPFLNKASKDQQIQAIHIALFSAIIHRWADTGFIYPVPISRKHLMYISKIRSRAWVFR